MPYAAGESVNEEVDRTLATREQVISMLQFHLKRAQDRKANLANKHRKDRSFNVGDFVYLKLQPHRQVTVRQGIQHKLSPKYFGPFEVTARVGKVAYKLNFSDSAAIHPVFHVSQLKLCRGLPTPGGSIPRCNVDGFLAVAPIAILDRKVGQRHGKTVMNVLVQWTNGTVEEATWEIYGDLLKRFPEIQSLFGDQKG